MRKKYSSFCVRVVLLLSVVVSASGVLTDNRFAPLLPSYRFLFEERNSYAQMTAHIASASHAFDTAERRVGLPEIYGLFDLGVLSRAYEKSGHVTPLRAYYQDKAIPYHLEGQVCRQGVVWNMEQALTPEFRVGGSCGIMRLHTHIDFMLGDVKFILSKDMEQEIDVQRRMLLRAMGIYEESSTQVSMSDIELFARIGKRWERSYKCKLIDIGIKGGIVFPTAPTWYIDRPSTIFADNQRFWGWYTSAELLCVLKEDLVFQSILQIHKRFAKTVHSRISLLGEPTFLGAAIGDLYIDPGVTVLFCPTLVLEHIRGGLGVAVSYNLLYHQKDHMKDMRFDKTVSAHLASMEEKSAWGADYVSVQAFYECEFSDRSSLNPAITLKWDIPTDIFVAKRVAKTHVLSLTVHCAY